MPISPQIRLPQLKSLLGTRPPYSTHPLVSLRLLVGFDLVLQQEGTDGVAQAWLLELNLEDSGGGEPCAAHRSRFPAVQAQMRDICLQPHMLIDMR
jgi:hypothetical protein